MTSKNSFLASSKENQKRRIWVWAASILMQCILYPGIMIVYLSRIKSWRDSYVTAELFKKALQEAAADAVGFQPNALVPVLLLGIIIGIQGFSYLYDKKKVDLYHSVPVSMKKRFFVIYVNGIVIYLLPALLGVLLALLIAVTQGAFCMNVLAECVLAFIGNLLYFLAVYHTAVLAVMLTGHVLITICAVTVFLAIEYVTVMIFNLFKELFFVHVDSFFGNMEEFRFSIVLDYLLKMNELKRMPRLSEAALAVLPVYGKWIVLGLVPFALAYFCYRKRPAEAAGNAIAFRQIKPFVKVIISVLAGLAAYYVVNQATYHRAAYRTSAFSLLCMVGAAALCAMLMEVIYDFDIRAAVKHIVSTGIAVAAVFVIFGIFQFDVFGYDDYIPDADKVESAAVNIGPYQEYYEWDEKDGWISYMSDARYLEANMYITDIETLCALAENNYDVVVREGELLPGEEWDVRGINVLYRLKSGRNVSRFFRINLADESNEELLNKLIGSAEYKEGYYQIMKGTIPLGELQKQMKITYSNGVITGEIAASDADGLRAAWMKDMEKFDYTLARNNRPCGYIRWTLGSEYMDWELPVYESFTDTIAFLEEQGAYYPVALRVEDIESLEVTNYHYDERDEYDLMVATGQESAQALPARGSGIDERPSVVTEQFDDPKEIEAILSAIYPNLEMYWNESDAVDRNYEITISFQKDAAYPYGRGYYTFNFFSGQIPDFVVERTAYAEAE